MLASLIIVFREIIEVGLIVGVALAATRGVPNRNLWVTSGFIGGLLGASFMAFLVSSLTGIFSGNHQEIFNAGILSVSVLMLIWHNTWMAKHGRKLEMEIRSFGQSISTGSRSLIAFALVIGLAVLREGTEIVLFLYSISLSGNDSLFGMVMGSILGVFMGGLVSILLYYGLLRIPPRYLFKTTTVLISLLTAGMSAQVVMFLEQAGIINVLTMIVWNSSGVLSNGSILGKILHTLVGYTDRPSLIQLIVYITTLTVIYGLMRYIGRTSKTPVAIYKPIP